MILCEVLVEVAGIHVYCGILAVSDIVGIIKWGMVDQFHELSSFLFLCFFIYRNPRDSLKTFP